VGGRTLQDPQERKGGDDEEGWVGRGGWKDEKGGKLKRRRLGRSPELFRPELRRSTRRETKPRGA